MMIFLNGFAPVGFKSTGFQIGGVSFWSVALLVWWHGFLIGVGLMVCVCVCGWGKKIRLRERVVVEGGRLIRHGFVFVCVCVCVCARGWGSLRKKNGWKAQENGILWKKYRIERNNNILIKIEFLDVGGIVKWYGISNKVSFWDSKKKIGWHSLMLML